MPWTAEQYVTRVLVQVATMSGRSVATLGEEAFALTLWTWGELSAMQREASVERLGERTDLAGMMAVAFHQPQDLQKMELRYRKAAGQLSQMFEQTRARMTALQERMAKAAPAAQPTE